MFSVVGCGGPSSDQVSPSIDGSAQTPVSGDGNDGGAIVDSGSIGDASGLGMADGFNDSGGADASSGLGNDAALEDTWRDVSQGSDAARTDAADANEAGAGGDDAQPSDPHAIDVYLIGGQSNATGQGYTRNLPAGFLVDTRVLLFTSGPPSLNSGAAADTWIPLQHASESPDRFGPEIGFGNTIQQLYSGRKIAIIKHARSATSLFQDWAPGSSASSRTGWGPEFTTFVDTVNPGLMALRSQGYNPTLRAMAWQQGENDAATVPTANAYVSNMTAFIARVRAQFTEPGMLFVYGYVMPPPNTAPGRDIVRQAEHDVDQDSGTLHATTGAFVVATDDLEQRAADPGTPLPNDHLHFGTAGQLELGTRLATKVHDHLPLP